MSAALEMLVHHVLQKIDCSKAEKSDIKEELLSHLQMAKSHFIENGHNDEEAEKLAIQEFGNPNLVGNAMQEAMFPHRRLLFLILPIISLITIFVTYLVALIQGDVFWVWLICAVLTSSLLLIFTGQHITKLERKGWLATTLIAHLFVFLYGYLITSMLVHWLGEPIGYLMICIILFTIFLIYRISLYDYSNANVGMKTVHFANITLGFPYVGLTLFFFWAAAFFMEGLEPYILYGVIPTFFWMAAYILQVQCIKRNRKVAAYSTMGLSIAIIIWVIWLLFRM